MTDSHEGDETRTREAVLADLRRVRERARYKTFGDGRIRDPERAQIRIKYLRLIVQAANAERRLLKDRDLEDLQERVARLEGDVPSGGPRDLDDLLEAIDAPPEGAVADGEGEP